MFEINILLCDSRIVSFGRLGKVLTLVMDEATAQLGIRIRLDGLRGDLMILCGDLKKNGYDFTMTFGPLLRDTEPVSHGLVRRLTARVKSWQEKSELSQID
jgi:hypothetical protein